MHGIKVLMARQYVDNLSEEVKKGMLEKAEQGIWPSKAPMGYLNVEGPNGKRVVIPDPEIGPIVKRMFEKYAQGNISLEDVGLLAMDEVLPLRREGNFRATVQYAYKNPFYYGDFVFKGKLYKGIHEGIISRECWDKVQEVRERRRATSVASLPIEGRVLSHAKVGRDDLNVLRRGRWLPASREIGSRSMLRLSMASGICRS